MVLINYCYVTESHKGSWTDVTERWVLKVLVPGLELEAVMPEKDLRCHLAELFFFVIEEIEAQRGEAVLSESHSKSGTELGELHHVFPTRMLFGIFRSFPPAHC